MQPTVTDIEKEVITIIVEQLGLEPQRVTKESTLDLLGADSLDQVEIIIKLQERFCIEIDDDAADRIKTVGDAIEYISSSCQL